MRVDPLHQSLLRHYNKYLSCGRVIRRVVTLKDRVEDLVSEADRRACIEQTDSSGELVGHSDE